MVGWLTEFESEELSARMTTEGSTGDCTMTNAHGIDAPHVSASIDCDVAKCLLAPFGFVGVRDLRPDLLE